MKALFRGPVFPLEIRLKSATTENPSEVPTEVLVRPFVLDINESFITISYMAVCTKHNL